METKEIDLRQFCARGDETREYLNAPWSDGEYSYATNGHILVRVPRRADVPERDMSNPITPEKVAHVIGERLGDVWRVPAVVTSLPDSTEDECYDCDGTGQGRHCVSCECVCAACDGRGMISSDRNKSTRYRGVPFALRYIRTILALPGLELADQRGATLPLRFRFDGGIGSLMALRNDCVTSVTVFADPLLRAQGAPNAGEETRSAQEDAS